MDLATVLCSVDSRMCIASNHKTIAYMNAPAVGMAVEWKETVWRKIKQYRWKINNGETHEACIPVGRFLGMSKACIFR